MLSKVLCYNTAALRTLGTSLVRVNCARYSTLSNACYTFSQEKSTTKESHNAVNYKGKYLRLVGHVPLISIERHHTIRRLTWPCDNLPFKWTRPVKPPSIFNSGDNEGLDYSSVEMSEPKGNFKLSKELVDASEDVKKVFSLEFASKKEINEAIKEKMLARIRRHPLDDSSIEVRIAIKSWRIRLLQEHMKKNMQDKRQKVLLHNTIFKRNKLLKILSRTHYERFEWLLKELNISYSPPPPGEIVNKITRKGELRRLTKEYCDNIREQRLQKYHDELKKQQKAFLEEKETFLNSLAKEQQ